MSRKYREGQKKGFSICSQVLFCITIEQAIWRFEIFRSSKKHLQRHSVSGKSKILRIFCEAKHTFVSDMISLQRLLLHNHYLIGQGGYPSKSCKQPRRHALGIPPKLLHPFKSYSTWHPHPYTYLGDIYPNIISTFSLSTFTNSHSPWWINNYLWIYLYIIRCHPGN